mmetsp:Transcript_54968/g.119890  ORF Transcript_54968/g.119890 Transcript_54968/m.119890 type:complete len:112 (-) Transcript_54968:1674-2009(-)
MAAHAHLRLNLAWTKQGEAHHVLRAPLWRFHRQWYPNYLYPNCSPTPIVERTRVRQLVSELVTMTCRSSQRDQHDEARRDQGGETCLCSRMWLLLRLPLDQFLILILQALA